jgi:hypothetical protein
MLLDSCLKDYIFDCENPDKNYELAHAYLQLNQTAPATSFFVRAAERYELRQQHERAYECLILAAHCFQMQGNRDTTVKSLLLTALNLCPKRPEAYFHISVLYKALERHSDYYTFANLALMHCDFDTAPLQVNTGYPGKYGLLYYKALACWWLGRVTECAVLYSQLREEYWEELSSEYKEKVVKDIASFNLF